VVERGTDALDLLRAGAVATWAVRDADPALAPNPDRLTEAVRAVEPGVTWAR